jgi:hypothetical protein
MMMGGWQGSMPTGFWAEPCPSRDAGLRHIKSNGANANLCGYCRQDATDWKWGAQPAEKLTNVGDSTSAGAREVLADWPDPNLMRAIGNPIEDYEQWYERLMAEAIRLQHSGRPLGAARYRTYANIVWTCMRADQRDLA